ncbi:hypothetical protein [Mycobacteroides abscessus]|uniref:hypothetical protein n=1 Tax=Mycobacteroides abscessus TaxID=36809 RepID=UPI00266C4767|nr:hypothetical protein [Mycobacteroides abscessus]MDO3177739.1 hypothetical protein [Mycobacteroides abscessus subsp. abscessus]
MSEADAIAARLASASQLFPLPHSDVDGRAVRDSVVYVDHDGDVVTVCVTDSDGIKREYHAAVRLVSASASEMRTAPADSGVGAPGRSSSEHPSTVN